MPTPIEFFYDFVSPTAYLAHLRTSGIAERTGSEVTYTPVFLGGVMKATGNSPPMAVPAKAGHAARDVIRFAERDGVPFQFDPNFPPDSVSLSRMAAGLREENDDRSFVDAVFHAMWAEARDLGDETVVREVIGTAGLDPDEVLAMAGDQANKDALHQNTDRAVAAGMFGAPTFLVGDELF